MKLACRALLSTLLLALVFVAQPAAAGLLERVDNDLVRRSELVVTGRCVHVETRWRGGGLFTLATVEVTDVLQGEPRDSVRVLLPGGVDMDRSHPVAMTWPGATTIVPGENVLLMLVPNLDEDDEFFVTGLTQGKLSLGVGDGGLETISRSSLEGDASK